MCLSHFQSQIFEAHRNCLLDSYLMQQSIFHIKYYALWYLSVLTDSAPIKLTYLG